MIGQVWAVCRSCYVGIRKAFKCIAYTSVCGSKIDLLNEREVQESKAFGTIPRCNIVMKSVCISFLYRY